MSCNDIRHASPVRRFDDGAISRVGGLALILYGGISLGLIVALAASLRAAPVPSACTSAQVVEATVDR